MISVVIPVFNEEDNITPLYEELEEVIPKLSEEYEIIFVDDGSTDNTLSNLLKLIEVHNHLRVIQFKHNFGKIAALTAGFNQVKGEIVVTLDGDGQDNPTNIPHVETKMVVMISKSIFRFCILKTSRSGRSIHPIAVCPDGKLECELLGPGGRNHGV